METDIRLMFESLTPVADFRLAVERTVSILNTRREDIHPMDSDDEEEIEEIDALLDFWGTIATNLEGEQ